MRCGNAVELLSPSEMTQCGYSLMRCGNAVELTRNGYFSERWLKIYCQVTLGIDMSGSRIMSIEGCESQKESDKDRLFGELASIIAPDQFDDEAGKFLTRYGIALLGSDPGIQ